MKQIDFGFLPEDSEHHFILYIPPKKGADIIMFEFFDYDPDLTKDALLQKAVGKNSNAKVILERSKWNAVEDEIRAEFNRRLKDQQLSSSKWKRGSNFIQRLLGKEATILLWAIEDADPGTIPRAIENWLGLKPEERWWLYTMTNAATGHPILDRDRGWRKALRFAITENPVRQQQTRLSLELHLPQEKLHIKEQRKLQL